MPHSKIPTIREKHQKWKRRREYDFLLGCCVESISVAGTSSSVDGMFWRLMHFGPVDGSPYLFMSVTDGFDYRLVQWNGVEYYAVVKYRADGDHVGWVVELYDNEEDIDVYEDEPAKVCWHAVGSANLDYPPSRGWKSVDKDARGSPEIYYNLKRHARFD